MKAFFEYGFRQINKKGEELCGDSVAFSVRPDWATLVLSDGLGSGVKASILSTLTTRIATRMLDEGLPLEEVVRTVSETLPICRVRKIAYSTFSIAQLFTRGQAQLVTFDSPAPFLVRSGRVLKLDFSEYELAGKRIQGCTSNIRPGDWLVLVSDGVLNAGIGGAHPLGWRWEEVARYLALHVHDALTADGLADKLARVVQDLYQGPPGDDVTIAVVKTRWRRVVVIMAGPPVDKQDDPRLVELLMSAHGRRVVCGGTTANIVARQLGRGIEVELETGTEAVPACARIEGLDLVTEGTLTLTRTLEIIRSDTPQEELKLRIDGASRLAVMLAEADEVRMLVGRAINPAHQNPNLPRQLGIKAQVIEAIAAELRGRGKQVAVEYY